MDGTLVPTRDKTIAASSKNYRASVNMQVMINAATRLVVAVGQPTPGNHNDCAAWTESKINRSADHATVLTDGGYQGTDCSCPTAAKPARNGYRTGRKPTTQPTASTSPHRAQLRRGVLSGGHLLRRSFDRLEPRSLNARSAEALRCTGRACVCASSPCAHYGSIGRGDAIAEQEDPAAPGPHAIVCRCGPGKPARVFAYRPAGRSPPNALRNEPV